MIRNNEELRVLLAQFLGYDEKTNLSELLNVLEKNYGIKIYKLETVSEEGLKKAIQRQKLQQKNLSEKTLMSKNVKPNP